MSISKGEIGVWLIAIAFWAYLLFGANWFNA